MVKQSPVIHPAPSERRKTAASAISGGVPNRLRGIRSRIFSSNEGSGHAVRGRSTERTARDFATLPSMRSRGPSAQNDAVRLLPAHKARRIRDYCLDHGLKLDL